MKPIYVRLLTLFLAVLMVGCSPGGEAPQLVASYPAESQIAAYPFTPPDLVVVYNATLTIEVEKHSNEVYPRNATLTGDNVEYTSSDGYIHINTLGMSQPIIIIDMIVALSILSTTGIAVVLGVLHVKGRITLPISRLRGAVNPSEPQKKEM